MNNTATGGEDRVGELVLKGALLIERAAEVKQELQNALEGVDTLMLNLEEVPEMDLSCIQLLCSAHRTAADSNKTLIRAGGPERSGLVEGAGMAARGCSFAGGQDCIWAAGEA